MSNNRTFVVLDGPDFAGKSFLMESFIKRVEAEGIPYLAMREPGCQPGQGSVAEEIRELLIATREEVLHPEADVMMHMAYRAQNVKNVIAPALNEGKWVISDRFIFSTWCLNVQAHLPTHPHLVEMFYGLMPYVLKGIPEPLTFILDTPRAIREERAASNKRKLDRYESQGKDVHDRIEAAYEQLRAAPSCVFLDGTKPTEELVDQMLETIRSFNEQLQEQLTAEKDATDPEAVVAKSAEDHIAEMRAELDADESWVLEDKLAEYVKTYVVDIAPQLFPGATGEQLERLTREGAEFGWKVATAAFKNTEGDRTIFHPSRIGQINQKVHSVLNYGFMRESWEGYFVKEGIEYTGVPVELAPEETPA